MNYVGQWSWLWLIKGFVLIIIILQSLVWYLLHSCSQVKVPVLAMRGGTDLQTYVDMLVPSNAKLTLIQVCFRFQGTNIQSLWHLTTGRGPRPPDRLPLYRILCRRGWGGRQWRRGWWDGGGFLDLRLCIFKDGRRKQHFIPMCFLIPRWRERVTICQPAQSRFKTKKSGPKIFV